MGFWGWAYLLGTYASGLICIYAAIRIGRQEGWKAGLTQIGILVFFVAAYWLLESMAHITAPFYGYPNMFPDMVPYFDWSWLGLGMAPGVGEHVCTIHASGFDRITFSVPVLEASVTYTLMWTTRLLLDQQGWAQSHQATFIAPFIAGLVALALDAFLDPIVSESFNCATTPGLIHPGLGFWRWFAEADLAHFWFVIPAFNYAAWYSAPVILITAILLASWLWDLFLYLMGFSSAKPSPAHLLVRILVFITFTVVHVTAPGVGTPREQIAAIAMAIVVSLVVVWSQRGNYSRNHPFRWEFVVPLIFFFSLPIFILLLSGVFSGILFPWLLPISVILAVVGIWFSLTPYRRWWSSGGP